MELYPHKSGIGGMEPIALQDQNVAVHYGTAVYYRKVTFSEAIPPFQAIDVGALAAGATSVRTAMPRLDMPDGEFAQFRWYPIDNIICRLWIPNTVGKYKLLAWQSYVDQTIISRDPCLHLTEFFVWENNRPSVEAMNPMDYALLASRIIVMGFRYVSTEIEDKALLNGFKSGTSPCTHIWASGIGS